MFKHIINRIPPLLANIYSGLILNIFFSFTCNNVLIPVFVSIQIAPRLFAMYLFSRVSKLCAGRKWTGPVITYSTYPSFPNEKQSSFLNLQIFANPFFTFFPYLPTQSYCHVP